MEGDKLTPPESVHTLSVSTMNLGELIHFVGEMTAKTLSFTA